MQRLAFLPAVLALVCACEDGPEQVFEPRDEDLPTEAGDRYVEPGGRSFDDSLDGDRVGRAKFCDEDETSAQIAEIATQPIVPDVSVGGIPLWAEDGSPLVADDLLGRPEDGKFCDPTGVYADAFVYGPTQEVIIFFDQDTRQVSGVMAYQSYLGTLEGQYTNGEGEKVDLVVQPRERVKIGDRELDQFTGKAGQADKPNAWLNHENVTAIYKMVRETFFEAEPFPADFNCVEEQLCDLIYTSSDDTVPADTFIDIRDSGIQMRFTPEGQVIFVMAEPVRVAPFEVAGGVSFGSVTETGGGDPGEGGDPGDDGGGPGEEEAPTVTATVAPRYDSVPMDDCSLDISAGITWAQFQENCVDLDRTLQRVNYSVATARDAVTVEFNGINARFMHDMSMGVLRDGQAPSDNDQLFGMSFTRTLSAPVKEFVPSELAVRYKELLEARVAGAAAGELPEGHPFKDWALTIPETLSSSPQRIGELTYIGPAGPSSWVADVIADIRLTYESLTSSQRALVSDRLLEPVFIVEPFVHAVIDAFSYGKASAPGSHLLFRSTDDERWSIAFAHFVQDGVPYRLVVQYSLNFGAITAIDIERGYSRIDDVLLAASNMARANVEFPPSPYYVFPVAHQIPNPLGLRGQGISVDGVDRELDTLDITVTLPGQDPISMTVSGDPIDARAGYLRQIRGERFEFVPAHEVRLLGKESSFILHVRADGTIGRVEQPLFKGSARLCGGGLNLAYGDDVRETIEAWRAVVGSSAYDSCELVFNYTEDGTVLESVASLTNKVSVSVEAGRATTAVAWQ